jgi:pSer/pThr/pTyr-binding forkhead associated (FHA) protein
MAAEYWCDLGLEITVEGPDGRSSVRVEKPFARIGRNRSSEVVLPTKDVPGRALYLHATESGVYYIRLLPPPSEDDSPALGWLAPGQTLRIGVYQIAAELAGGLVSADTVPPDFQGADSAEPCPLLTVVHNRETVAHHPLQARLSTVGRDQHNTLRLVDSQVSTSHCVLYRQQERLWVIDLLSSNGTFLAGHRVETALVPPSQPLSLGSHVELVCLPASQTDEDLDDLAQHVTGRMIRLDRQARRRRWLLAAALVLLVLLGAAAAAFFLPREYLANFWEYVSSFRDQRG